MQQLESHHLHSKLSLQTCGKEEQYLPWPEQWWWIYLCGTLEKKLWNSEDVELRGNLSPILCGWDVASDTCLTSASFGGVGEFRNEVCWGELWEGDGEGGGEVVGVEVGVKYSSEFARECVRGEDVESCSSAKLQFSVWPFRSCSKCVPCCVVLAGYKTYRLCRSLSSTNTHTQPHKHTHEQYMYLCTRWRCSGSPQHMNGKRLGWVLSSLLTSSMLSPFIGRGRVWEQGRKGGRGERHWWLFREAESWRCLRNFSTFTRWRQCRNDRWRRTVCMSVKGV